MTPVPGHGHNILGSAQSPRKRAYNSLPSVTRKKGSGSQVHCSRHLGIGNLHPISDTRAHFDSPARVEVMLYKMSGLAMSDPVLDAKVAHVVQRYFKQLLYLLCVDRDYTELRPWILRGPSQQTPAMPSALQLAALNLVQTLARKASPKIAGEKAYRDLMRPFEAGGWERGSLERLILSDVPALIFCMGTPGLTKDEAVIYAKPTEALGWVPRANVTSDHGFCWAIPLDSLSF